MELVQGQGAQNDIDPNHIPKDDILKKRVYAFFLDLFFISILSKAIVYTYTEFLDYYFPHVNAHTKEVVISHFTKMQFPVYIIVFISYFLISYYVSNGKTPAKVIFGLKLQGKDLFNDNINFQQAALRSTCYFIGVFMGFLPLALPLFRKSRLGIPDIISNTEVYTDRQLAFMRRQLLKRHAHQEEEKDQLELFVS